MLITELSKLIIQIFPGTEPNSISNIAFCDLDFQPLLSLETPWLEGEAYYIQNDELHLHGFVIGSCDQFDPEEFSQAKEWMQFELCIDQAISFINLLKLQRGTWTIADGLTPIAEKWNVLMADIVIDDIL